MLGVRDERWAEIPPAPDRAAEDHSALPIFGIRVLRHEDWSAILLRGELDLASQGRSERALRAELRRGRPVIVELAGLDFTDVNGIRVLQKMVAHAAMLTPPVPIELHGARGQVADLILRLGLEPLSSSLAIP